MSRTELGRKLWLQRQKILNSGIPLVDEKEKEIWTMAKQTVRNFSNPGLTWYGYTPGKSRINVHKARNIEIFMPVDWDQRAQATLPNGIVIEGRLDAVITYINSGFKGELP